MNIDFIVSTFFAALKGIPVTLSIMLVAVIASLLPALFLAIALIRKVPVLTSLIQVYLAIVRATPLIVLILFFYSLLPSLLNQLSLSLNLGIDVFSFNPIIYAYIIFALIALASLTEIFRSALLAIDYGQWEAALSSGLTPWKSFERIIFPQLFKVALPSFTNLVIELVKGTSLVFVMTVQDITAIAKTAAAYSYNYTSAYIVIFVIYLLLCGGLQYLGHLVNRYYLREA
ncbi:MULTISPECIES: amino acid ABC transporter permease [Aerococcus]|uniref:amino acid ABC transporter permease n=1 Tax=Aerococcus TaxID=1375 RepID=UPI0018A746C5|nr:MULTISPECIES: ABC transporter permease subunit [Aerococcus]MCY3035751.1 ABC transporter permease subunit [Aerococcus sp. Group 2]MCY3039885.1 ABC transporter permease subunit [Aerococcus sp. Group 2]MCY3040419.1 ABC transporter permease subunit [Aerococcus sp. Group 2]MCY3043343.1 ABC transporter permease subunit [Aerococcus sp. Group 2]MDK6519863.1 ABC transporter permease subunit [Aerococcus urinae]